MRQIMYLMGLLLTIQVAQAQSNAEDHQLIAKTLNYYLEGGTNNDFNILKKAFHPTATMKFITADGYQEVNAIKFFQERMKPSPKSDRKTRIVYINVSGHAANARLEIEYPTFTFIDYMNLLKVDGEWKIVSKIFYKAE